MAIVFDWYENPNASSEEEEALHPRIFMNGKGYGTSLHTNDCEDVKEAYFLE